MFLFLCGAVSRCVFCWSIFGRLLAFTIGSSGFGLAQLLERSVGSSGRNGGLLVLSCVVVLFGSLAFLGRRLLVLLNFGGLGWLALDDLRSFSLADGLLSNYFSHVRHIDLWLGCRHLHFRHGQHR